MTTTEFTEPNTTVSAAPLPAPDEIVYLEPEAIHFRQEDNRLQMQHGEEDWREVSLARLFPFSEPENWISVLDKDGKEIGILKELKGLPREDLACVRRELDRRYMVPVIRRVVACKDMRDIIRLTVETDRGRRTFFLRNFSESIQQPFPGYYIMTDVEGNRYDIPVLADLDEESRRHLDICL